MADEIERLVTDNNKMDYPYSEATMEEFKSAVTILRSAYIYAHRIDWLVSGDDGEETFHIRLQEALNDLNK